MFKMKIKKLNLFFLIFCVAQLYYILQYRSGFELHVFKSPFNENSGIVYALPLEVIESNYILTKNQLSDFNLSKNFKEDAYLYQRAVEFNYPIRINENSINIFFLPTENIANNCKLVENGNYLKLARC